MSHDLTLWPPKGKTSGCATAATPHVSVLHHFWSLSQGQHRRKLQAAFHPPSCVIFFFFFSWKKMKATLSLSPFRSLSQPRPTFPKLPNFFSGGAGGRASLYTDLARTNHGTARAAPQNAIKWVGRGIGGSSTRACWALWRRRRTASRGESCSLSVRAPAIRSWRRAVTRRTDWCWTSRRCFMTAPSTASL